MLHTKSSAWRRAGYPNVSEQKEKEKEREKEKEKEILTHPPHIDTDLLYPVLSVENTRGQGLIWGKQI